MRREIPHVVAWVLASMTGWGLGALVSQWIVYPLIAQAEQASPAGLNILSSMLINSITGLIAGAITGLVFVWIVRQPEKAMPEVGGEHVR